jgi:hypothetical protein
MKLEFKFRGFTEHPEAPNIFGYRIPHYLNTLVFGKNYVDDEHQLAFLSRESTRDYAEKDVPTWLPLNQVKL